MPKAVNTFAFIDDVYDRCGSVKVTRHRVKWPELEALSRNLKGLQRKLGEQSRDDYWGDFIRPLRRYMFLISSTPLAPSDPSIFATGLIEQLNTHLRQVHRLYPDLAHDARYLLEQFSQIAALSSNPLLEKLEGIFKKRIGEAAALALKETRFIPEVEYTLRLVPYLKKVKVVGTHQLRDDNCFDSIAILGAPVWYPEYIFTAPRASEIHIVAYSWLNISWKPEAAFIGSYPSGKKRSNSSGIFQREDHSDEIRTEGLMSAEDLLPQINFEALSERVARNYDIEREHDMVDAKLFVLEGGASVFIEASDNAKALIIDPDGDKDGRGEASRLKRILTSDVEPGTYLLLRTSGGGNYIVQVADKILGDRAKRMRAGQERWKRLLREEVRRRGLFEASIALLELGAIRADENNLRNWMSSRNIRPDDRRDFQAIMSLTGIEDSADEYWMNANALTKAHMSAGRHIRSLLLNGVATADLDELERTGRMDFELIGEDAGRFTAFCVLAVSEKKYKILVAHLDEPFESEDSLWRE